MKKRNVRARQYEAWMRRVMKHETLRHQPVPRCVERYTDAQYEKMMERA